MDGHEAVGVPVREMSGAIDAHYVAYNWARVQRSPARERSTSAVGEDTRRAM